MGVECDRRHSDIRLIDAEEVGEQIWCDDCRKRWRQHKTKLREFLCSKCRSAVIPDCDYEECRGCGLDFPACVFIDRIEGKRCPICTHKSELAISKLECIEGCSLCELGVSTTILRDEQTRDGVRL